MSEQNNNIAENLPLHQTNEPLWQLVALSPQLGDLSINIGNSLSLGRSDSNDVVLAIPQISRQHAKINRVGDRLYVQDLGSANGTFVNGERIDTQAVQLQPTDELSFADLAFLVHLDISETSNYAEFEQNLQEVLPTGSNESVVTTSDEVAQPHTTTTPVTDKPLDIISEHDTPDVASQAVSNTAVISNAPSKEIFSAKNSQEPLTQANAKDNLSNDTTKSLSKPQPEPSILEPTIKPTVQVDKNSPIVNPNQSTIGSKLTKEQQTTSKKNATLAIIIVIVIALIIIASLFLK